MFKKISVFSPLVVIAFLLLISSCKKSDNPTEPETSPVSIGPIKTGDVVQVTTQNLGSSGGIITITKPGTPLNGMTITIPQDGYSTSNTFTVSYAPISSHNLGSNFNPVSPLITISNGGAFSNMPMTIKIPIKKAKDEFAIGFSYDANTGKLEAVPIAAADDSTVTIATRHFGTASTSANIFGKYADATSMGTFVISSIKESLLSSQTVLNTGFTPGVDDWEFINYGSYIATGGHCAGQSMTAMWYYYEKKLKGENGLFHRYDKLNNNTQPNLLWQDNPLGFRFASTIQEDFDWDGWVTKVNIQNYLPSLTWKTFIAAMLITGDPQFVIIKKSGTEIGHAMIVYKIGVAEGKLYVADPNYPNNRGQDGSYSLRTITYANGKFTPYDSFLKAGDPGVTFDQIAFFGKTANIDWAQITKRYAEISTKTIGKDRFPAYNLLMKQGSNFVAFNDGAVLSKDTLIIVNKSNNCSQAIAGTDNYQFIEVYDTTGNRLASGDFTNKGITTLKLKPGANKLGLYMMGATGNVATRYVDFQWVTVYYQTLSIDPNPLQGEPTKEVSFKAISKGTAPKGNSKFVWTFGDNTSQLTKTNDSTATHTYAAEGTYTVKVELYENSTNKKLTEATSIATITKVSDLLKQLQSMNQLTAECSFSYVNQVGYVWTGAFNVLAISPPKDTIKWSGTSFTYSYQTIENYDNSGFKSNYYTTVTGTVANDAKSVLQITYDHHVDYYRYFQLYEVISEKMSFKNVPMTRYPGYQEWGSGTIYNDFVFEFDKAGSLTNTTFLELKWSQNPNFDIIGIDKLKSYSTPLKINFVKKK